MIDTHCHLTDPRLVEQLDDVFARAAAARVGRMITIGTDLDDDREAIEICQGRRDFIRCAVGIHPNYSADASVADVEQLEELQSHPAVVALGEMGLDYHYDRAPAHQAEIFQAQLDLARRVGRPVVIHCREAVADTLAMLRNFPSVPAVFHCFTGSPDEARQIIDAGHLLGFTGPVTFKKNDALREAVRLTPLDRILVETDAPYLSPEPHRGQKTNEPALVIHTARMVGQVKGISYEEIDRVTTANAEKFFSLSEST